MTIKEIARLAGVSNSAVSRYMNRGSLSDDKREKIKKVIEETNYIPSSYARAMRTRKSNQIGVIVPKINSESVSRVVSGISKVLNEAGYNFLLADTDRSLEKELEYLEVFRQGQIDGVIFMATIVTKKHIEHLRELQKPLVLVGQNIPEFACVYHDDYMAAYQMTKTLLDTKCKRFAYIGVTEKDVAAGKSRKEGMLRAAREHDLKEEDIVMAISDFTMESGRTAMRELLQQAPDIDGVFCATDSIAIGAMDYLKEIHRRIPKDVKICGIGDKKVSRLITPKLTTVHYYYKTSGIEAANMLLDRIQTEEQPTKHTMLGYELRIQDTI